MREPYRWGDPKPPAAARVAQRRYARENRPREWTIVNHTTGPVRLAPQRETKSSDPLSWDTP